MLDKIAAKAAESRPVWETLQAFVRVRIQELLQELLIQEVDGLYVKAGLENGKAALERDWDRMVTFFDFPREHWLHLRTTNVVESPFAAVRLRTNAGKRYKRVENATALIWKLLTVAEKTFRRLNAPHLLAAVAVGAKFLDGMPVHSSTESVTA